MLGEGVQCNAGGCYGCEMQSHFGDAAGSAPVSIRASADIPGRTSVPSAGCGSSTIFTGMRCTTLVKLPVALSGGSSANVLPVPGDQLSTCPVSTSPGNASTVTCAGSPSRTC